MCKENFDPKATKDSRVTSKVTQLVCNFEFHPVNIEFGVLQNSDERLCQDLMQKTKYSRVQELMEGIQTKQRPPIRHEHRKVTTMTRHSTPEMRKRNESDLQKNPTHTFTKNYQGDSALQKKG
eukprot:TRINITY_DN6891_c0_g2_i1.p1 TRINITY_DN6891_c0_g2~~TRINITY_DN6891_c0_g2_i1.p1  ORF type:complete len:123 (+),score=15.17 TRINITY_DN6891_c0_g2_i1:185-553(+)